MTEKAFLAVDLGASSGRHVLGRFDGRRLALEEVHRFENGPVEAAGRLYWDVLGLWGQIRRGMHAASEKCPGGIAGMGVDTWGVDFALLGRGDELLGNPHHYRDARTDGILDAAFQIVPREEIFRQTGLQFMPINTLYQLLAMRRAGSSLLDAAESLLMMPDLFHWLLTGEKCNEMTDAGTTQFYNPVEGRWAVELFERFGLPSRILERIVPPGTILGPMRANLAAETRLAGAKVILPGTHDTASAVLAVPARITAAWSTAAPGRENTCGTAAPGREIMPRTAEGGCPTFSNLQSLSPDWCYISLGTWALMGIESPRPMVNETVFRHNFSNEGGVGGTTRVLKNITGLWLLQECRRAWNQRGDSLDWETLNRLAAVAPPLRSLVDPDAPDFAVPGDMPEAIRAFCRRTGQPVPEDQGAVLRCALESIALKFRVVLGFCEELAGRRIETIHIVGGGTKNRQLCQAAADACRRRVVAGPVEATAIGNIMLQAVALGEAASIAEAREIIRRSFPVEEYEPRNAAAWDDAYERFVALI